MSDSSGRWAGSGGAPLVCPYCSSEVVVRLSRTARNPNRNFCRCVNHPNCPFWRWVDECGHTGHGAASGYARSCCAAAGARGLQAQRCDADIAEAVQRVERLVWLVLAMMVYLVFSVRY